MKTRQALIIAAQVVGIIAIFAVVIGGMLLLLPYGGYAP